MLMDFQIEGGQAASAEIDAEMQHLPGRAGSQIQWPVPITEKGTAFADILTLAITLAIFASAFTIINRALV